MTIRVVQWAFGVIGLLFLVAAGVLLYTSYWYPSVELIKTRETTFIISLACLFAWGILSLFRIMWVDDDD